MSEEELQEMEHRARHAVEPWRPEASYIAKLKDDLHKLIAEVRKLSLVRPVVNVEALSEEDSQKLRRWFEATPGRTTLEDVAQHK